MQHHAIKERGVKELSFFLNIIIIQCDLLSLLADCAICILFISNVEYFNWGHVYYEIFDREHCYQEQY